MLADTKELEMRDVTTSELLGLLIMNVNSITKSTTYKPYAQQQARMLCYTLHS